MLLLYTISPSGALKMVTIDLLDEIYTSTHVIAALAQSQGDVLLRINSPGGDVFEGVAIFNALKSSGRKITVEILGQASSIASLIAMSGHHISAYSNAQIMVHKPWIFGAFNSNELEEMLSRLKVTESLMRPAYLRGGKVNESVVNSLFTDKDNWMGALAAKEMGLIDEVKNAYPVELKTPLSKALMLAKIKQLKGKKKVDLSELKDLMNMGDVDDQTFAASVISLATKPETAMLHAPDDVTNSLVARIAALENSQKQLNAVIETKEKDALISANKSRLPTQQMRDYVATLSLSDAKAYIGSLPAIQALSSTQTSVAEIPADDLTTTLTPQQLAHAKMFNLNPKTFAEQLAKIKGGK